MTRERKACPKPVRAEAVKNPGESRTRKLVAVRSGGVCERCGLRDAESVHHRLKKSQGGRWSPANCVAVCGDGVRGCHGYIEEHPDAAFAEGFHVRPWCDPKSVAIHSDRHGHALLTDDGRVLPASTEQAAS